MPYWQLYYHAVWATKNREPLLTPEVEPQIYGWLRQNADALGATVFALNGVEGSRPFGCLHTAQDSRVQAHWPDQGRGIGDLLEPLGC